MVCDGVLCAILQPNYIFNSWTNKWHPVKCPAYYWAPLVTLNTTSKAIYSNFRQLNLQETLPKSFSWQFPETGAMWRYLTQVLFTPHKILFQTFPFWNTLSQTPNLPSFSTWKIFQSLSPALVLPAEHVIVCLHLLFRHSWNRWSPLCEIFSESKRAKLGFSQYRCYALMNKFSSVQ